MQIHIMKKKMSLNDYLSRDPELQLHFEKLKVVNLSNELQSKLHELNESKKKKSSTWKITQKILKTILKL